MTTIVKQHSQETKNEIENDELFKLLSQELEDTFKQECWYLKDSNVFGRLRDLINQTLTDLDLLEIVRPWVRGLQLARIIKNIDITREKAEAEAVCVAIKTLKKYFSRITPARDKIRYIMESKLLDYNQAHHLLDSMSEHASFFLNQRFKNGAELNPDYIKRYAVYSLFDIGVMLNLSKVGNPSPLYTFIKLITNLDNKEVSQYFSAYIKTTIQDEVNKTSILRFIYNPPKII